MTLRESWRRRRIAARRRWREVRMVARALASPAHPILVQMVATRRCNLACGYCNEFDDHSAPVPTSELLARVDHVATLGASIVELTGGEPLLHSDLDVVVQRIRTHGAMAGVLTNGYPLTSAWIARLNRAGLDHMQISIDNVVPDDVSRKSLSLLERILRLLAAEAEFSVNINSVIGAGTRDAGDPVTIARRAADLGFTMTAGLIHDGTGRLVPLDAERQRAYAEVSRTGGSFYSVARANPFQIALVQGRPNAWHCPAGGRYLYVCEDGLVHWCSQQRGTPGIPLSEYGPADLAREAATVKSCAPFCTVSCVHRVALLDDLRQRPLEVVARVRAAAESAGTPMPRSVRGLEWLFVTSPARQLFRRGARAVFGIR